MLIWSTGRDPMLGVFELRLLGRHSNVRRCFTVWISMLGLKNLWPVHFLNWSSNAWTSSVSWTVMSANVTDT
jgi:hypothetical protein